MKKFTCLNASSSMYCTKNRVIPCNSIKKLDRRKRDANCTYISWKKKKIESKGELEDKRDHLDKSDLSQQFIVVTEAQ